MDRLALSFVDSASYKKTVSIMAATYERDKFCKILQYWYRFLSWRATNENRPKDGAALMKISGNVSLARKLFRVGYSLEEVNKFVHQLFDVKGDHNADSLIQASRSLVSAIYWMLDNWYWAQKIELFNVADTAKVNRYRIGFWLASVLLSLPSAFKAFVVARSAVKRDDPKTQQAANVSTANLLRLGSDVVVASSFAVTAEVIPPLFTVHEGIVGLSGVASGAAGVYMTLYK